LILALLLAAAGGGGDVAEIKSARARSNAALAEHRLEELRPLLAEGYTALPGSSGRPLSAAQTEQRLAAAFADPTFIAYARTPRRIVVARSRKRAAETGIWVGRWNKMDGVMRLSGVYQATWVPSDHGWRLLNESFVTLACTGSQACSEMD
jgi:imidazolonepropionase-like amidohydrolase